VKSTRRVPHVPDRLIGAVQIAEARPIVLGKCHAGAEADVIVRRHRRGLPTAVVAIGVLDIVRLELLVHDVGAVVGVVGDRALLAGIAGMIDRLDLPIAAAPLRDHQVVVIAVVITNARPALGVQSGFGQPAGVAAGVDNLDGESAERRAGPQRQRR